MSTTLEVFQKAFISYFTSFCARRKAIFLYVNCPVFAHRIACILNASVVSWIMSVFLIIFFPPFLFKDNVYPKTILVHNTRDEKSSLYVDVFFSVCDFRGLLC